MVVALSFPIGYALRTLSKVRHKTIRPLFRTTTIHNQREQKSEAISQSKEKHDGYDYATDETQPG